MRERLEEYGYEIINSVYSESEIYKILAFLENAGMKNQFGVREVLVNNPGLKALVFTPKLIELIKTVAPGYSKSVKSIYFDKPPSANWIVNWHQDLTINVTEKKEVEGFKNWRVNSARTVVQPSPEVLEGIFTIRIHLDDCTRENGALRIIEKSHRKGVIEIKKWVNNKEGNERICEVPKGGILLMKPLTLHSSRRTENDQNRRILHIEFTDVLLPSGLQWKEEFRF